MESVLAQQPVQERELQEQLTELTIKVQHQEDENQENEEIFGDHLV